MTGCAEKILSKDVQLFCKLNITSKLWNGALYPVLDMLRGSCSSGEFVDRIIVLEVNDLRSE